MCLILIVGAYFIHGFPDFWSFLVSAWVCLIVGGILVIIWEKSGLFRKKQDTSGKDKKWTEGLDAFQTGMSHYKGRDFQKALGYFNEAIECGFQDRVYELRGDCLRECGSHEKSINDYDTALSMRPGDCNLYYMRSFSKAAIGDLDGAMQDLQEAVKLSKIDNELNRTYRLSALEMGWPDGHTSLYERGIISMLLRKRVAQINRDHSRLDDPPE